MRRIKIVVWIFFLFISWNNNLLANKTKYYDQTKKPPTTMTDLTNKIGEILQENLGSPHRFFYNNGKKYSAWEVVFTDGIFFLVVGDRGVVWVKKGDLPTSHEKGTSATLFNYTPYKINDAKIGIVFYKLNIMLHSVLGKPSWSTGSGIVQDYWVLDNDIIIMSSNFLEIQIRTLPFRYKDANHADQIKFIENAFEKPLYLFK